MGAPSGNSSRVVKLSFPCLTCTFCLIPPLVLTWCWHLPLLISGAVLDIVAHIATSEALVPIALAELLLLRRLIVPRGGS
jgi:hypothetical protein